MGANTPFKDIKILDFTNEVGAYCTKLFADLGAEVLKVEPLCGDTTRKRAPFYKDIPGEETSLIYLYLNTNKKSMTLNIETATGQQIIKKLLKEYDVIVENFPPGYLSSLGLGYEQLMEIQPKLIFTSITPFGQDGPYKDFKATDIVNVAMGGFMNLGGYPDTPPIRPYGNQSYFAASLFAAVGTLLAILHRDRHNEGQYVDVSMQESIAMAMENAVQLYDLEGVVRKRGGVEGFQAGWGLYPCKDGEIFIMSAGLSSSNAWESLIKWLADYNIENWKNLEESKWQELDWRLSEEGKKEFYDIFTQLTLQKTKLELYEEGQHRGVPISPVNNVEDMLNNPQLKAREFFQTIYHDNLADTVTYPGPPYRMSDSKWSISPAPKKGEHTHAVLQQLGFTNEDIIHLREGGVI